MEALLLYGGSFDPVHNGHLRMARAASMKLNADVIFIPASIPRWKNPVATPKQRLDMLRIALKEGGTPSFSIDLYEFNRKDETNYTIDTVAYFAKKYPRRKLYILIGADQANKFAEWKDPERLCRLATPIYCPRPGVTPDDAILQKYGILRLDCLDSGEVSSTDVRNLRNSDIPFGVRKYIEDNRLYYFDELSRLLTPERLIHSISVANLAYSIALRNKNPSAQKAYLSGLLHDIGKKVKGEEAMAIMGQRYPSFLAYPEWTYHQFISEYLAKEKFGITDSEILTAINRHATGDVHMPPLAKIIYSADKIEPGRGYDSAYLIKACYKNYYAGFLAVLEANMEYLGQKGYKIDNQLTQDCVDLYLGEANE